MVEASLVQDRFDDAVAQIQRAGRPSLASIIETIEATCWNLDCSERALATAFSDRGFDAARIRDIVNLRAAREIFDLFALAEDEVRAVFRRVVRNRAIGQIERRA